MKETFGDLEGRGDVPGLLLDRKAGLGAGATGTDEKVGTAGGLGQALGDDGILTDGILTRTKDRDRGRCRGKRIGNGLGKDFGLIVTAGPAAGPMERDGDDEVNVLEVRG